MEGALQEEEQEQPVESKTELAELNRRRRGGKGERERASLLAAFWEGIHSSSSSSTASIESPFSISPPFSSIFIYNKGAIEGKLSKT